MNGLLAGLPLLPLVHNVETILLAMYLLARVSGMILIAPLLSNASINGPTRAFLTFFTVGIMASVLYPDYFGETARFFPVELDIEGSLSLPFIAVTMMKELTIGYVIGFSFNLIFEALLLAGQLLSVMIGFSIAEIIDPVSGTSQSTVAQVFTLTASLVLLCLDMHHSFFYVTAKSFQYIPLGHYHMPQELLQEITHGTSRMLSYGLRFPAAPYVVLFLVTIALGFMAKIMPEMNIFMLGFPIRILLGLYGLIFAVRFFPLLFQQGFQEFQNLAIHVLRHIGGL